MARQNRLSGSHNRDLGGYYTVGELLRMMINSPYGCHGNVISYLNLHVTLLLANIDFSFFFGDGTCLVISS